MILKRGFVHLYTGNGKGKTTAAIGLAIRAAGAGLKVFFGQFLKTNSYSEHKILAGIDGIEVETFGRDCLIKGEPTSVDYELARKGFEKIQAALMNGNYDVVVADEINVAVHYNLINEGDVLTLMKNKPENKEFILTGRYASKSFYEFADLITEFKEVKHYFKKGILARDGIEK